VESSPLGSAHGSRSFRSLYAPLPHFGFLRPLPFKVSDIRSQIECSFQNPKLLSVLHIESLFVGRRWKGTLRSIYAASRHYGAHSTFGGITTASRSGLVIFRLCDW